MVKKQAVKLAGLHSHGSKLPKIMTKFLGLCPIHFLTIQLTLVSMRICDHLFCYRVQTRHHRQPCVGSKNNISDTCAAKLNNDGAEAQSSMVI